MRAVRRVSTLPMQLPYQWSKKEGACAATQWPPTLWKD